MDLSPVLSSVYRPRQNLFNMCTHNSNTTIEIKKLELDLNQEELVVVRSGCYVIIIGVFAFLCRQKIPSAPVVATFIFAVTVFPLTQLLFSLVKIKQLKNALKTEKSNLNMLFQSIQVYFTKTVDKTVDKIVKKFSLENHLITEDMIRILQETLDLNKELRRKRDQAKYIKDSYHFPDTIPQELVDSVKKAGRRLYKFFPDEEFVIINDGESSKIKVAKKIKASKSDRDHPKDNDRSEKGSPTPNRRTG